MMPKERGVPIIENRAGLSEGVPNRRGTAPEQSPSWCGKQRSAARRNAKPEPRTRPKDGSLSSDSRRHTTLCQTLCVPHTRQQQSVGIDDHAFASTYRALPNCRGTAVERAHWQHNTDGLITPGKQPAAGHADVRA